MQPFTFSIVTCACIAFATALQAVEVCAGYGRHKAVPCCQEQPGQKMSSAGTQKVGVSSTSLKDALHAYQWFDALH